MLAGLLWALGLTSYHLVWYLVLSTCWITWVWALVETRPLGISHWLAVSLGHFAVVGSRS